MKQILLEASKLVCEKGKIWLWRLESMEIVHSFATKEDAQKYIDLMHQFCREKGWFQSTHPYRVRLMSHITKQFINQSFNPRTHTGCDHRL